MMPGIDGLEVLKRLKRNEKTLHIPVIMLTAKNEDKSKIKAAGLFCEDYIVKPVEIRVLRSKINKVLSMTKLSRPPFAGSHPKQKKTCLDNSNDIFQL